MDPIKLVTTENAARRHRDRLVTSLAADIMSNPALLASVQRGEQGSSQQTELLDYTLVDIAQLSHLLGVPSPQRTREMVVEHLVKDVDKRVLNVFEQVKQHFNKRMNVLAAEVGLVLIKEGLIQPCFEKESVLPDNIYTFIQDIGNLVFADMVSGEPGDKSILSVENMIYNEAIIDFENRYPFMSNLGMAELPDLKRDLEQELGGGQIPDHPGLTIKKYVTERMVELGFIGEASMGLS